MPLSGKSRYSVFLLSILLITGLTAFIPYLVTQADHAIAKFRPQSAPAWLPILAAGLFVGAFFIPNVHISNETSTFQQHFVGGGIYTACLYMYFKKLLGWRFHWLVTLIVLFAWTSAFGVANELMEFTLTKLHLAQIGSGDTDWDLLANTCGTFCGYALLYLCKVERLEKP